MSLSYTEKLYKADINFSASGDNTIIAAPGAGHYIAIDFVQVIPSAAVTIQFKDGSTNYGGPLPLAQQQTITNENSMCHEHGVITMSDNSAFVINTNGAVQVGGFVRYRIVGN